MPYIDQNQRPKFADALNNLHVPENAGELNYFITKVCHAYIVKHGKRYEHLNAVVGALECAKLELYRRVAAPYEDTKIAMNGDVLCGSTSA